MICCLSKIQIELVVLYFIWQLYLQKDMTERGNKVSMSKREEWYTCTTPPPFPVSPTCHLLR